jgi:hypothetical protein
MSYPTITQKTTRWLELYLANEEIAEIEGRNTYQPELVMAV